MSKLAYYRQPYLGPRKLIFIFIVSFVFNTSAETGSKNVENEQRQLLIKKFEKGKYSKKGADTCLKCHDQDSDLDATKIFANRHGVLTDKNAPMGQLQCETCHGPIGKHDKRPRKNKMREPMLTFDQDSLLTAGEKDSVCLSCHNDHNRISWISSEHESNDVACVDCHTLHVKQDPVLTQVNQNNLCTSCHKKQKIEMHKRSSHPFKFNRQICTDCHNPHDSSNDASLIKATINDTCLGCHSEKRGPNLWEHEPVKESCTNCHTPHGSNNAMLLKRRAPQLCQECHTAAGHTSTAYAEAIGNKVQGKSCLNCHSKIHGSNHPGGDLFQR